MKIDRRQWLGMAAASMAGRLAAAPPAAGLGALLAGRVGGANVAASVAAAAADLASLPEKHRQNYRYLDDCAVPAQFKGSFQKLINAHVNSLSREADLEPLATVPGSTLYRVDLTDYGIDPATWERLASVEPYYHQEVKADLGGGKTELRNAHASWLPPQAVDFLVKWTDSNVPVCRADWFFHQTAIQAERAAGYYDFLGLKSRDDFFKLVGMDPKVAAARKRELYAIVTKSGVAQRNRQIVRFGAVDSSAWTTLDVTQKAVGRRNAVDNLGDDYQHDAEEHYGFLPNGLFACYLSDAAGKGQDSAPDTIGPDKTSTSNDGRIHAYLSCVRCHREGLRPIDDFARKFYTYPFALAFSSKEEQLEKRRKYLGDLQFNLKRDVEYFEHKLAHLTGWRPAQMSEAYTYWWSWYADEDVTLARAADEWGSTPDLVRAAFTRHALPPPAGFAGRIKTTLGALINPRVGAVPREHFEEAFAVGVLILQGGIAP